MTGQDAVIHSAEAVWISFVERPGPIEHHHRAWSLSPKSLLLPSMTQETLCELGSTSTSRIVSCRQKLAFGMRQILDFVRGCRERLIYCLFISPNDSQLFSDIKLSVRKISTFVDKET